jgi:hypothetical protein
MAHPYRSRPVLDVTVHCRVSCYQVGDTQAEPQGDASRLVDVEITAITLTTVGLHYM